MKPIVYAGVFGICAAIGAALVLASCSPPAKADASQGQQPQLLGKSPSGCSVFKFTDGNTDVYVTDDSNCPVAAIHM